MKKVFFILIFLCLSLHAQKISKGAISQSDFDSMVRDCDENSFSNQCFFVGFDTLFPKISQKIYPELNFTNHLDKQKGLEFLKKACIYDKNKKIIAIKSDKNQDLITVNPTACYTLFLMYETFGDTSNYHQNYIKAMRPYESGYDDVDFYSEIKKYSEEKKDLETALKYYKHMCYESSLQIQCAKYQGFKVKLRNLCKKGHKYACDY